MRDTLPGYEKAYHDLYERVEANDLTGAESALAAITRVGQPLYDAIDHARALKVRRGDETFKANYQSFRSARSLLLSALVLALVLGVLIGIFIARGFSVPLGRAVAALGLVAGGDITVLLDVDTKDEVGQMATALNTALEKLRSTLADVVASAGALELLFAGAVGGSRANRQWSAGASGQPGRDLGQPGADHRCGSTKRRQRQAGQTVGDQLTGISGTRSGGGLQRDRRHGGDQHRFGEDIRHYLDHQ
jgi:methyl-accepting chemotaxis protein